MVVLSLEEYSKLTDGAENAMDEAELAAESDSRRYTHNEVFEGLKKESKWLIQNIFCGICHYSMRN